MTCAVTQPTLFDLLKVCHAARGEEVTQYEAVSGKTWDADRVANELFNKPGIKFTVIDEDVISIGGWEPILPGVYESWMVGTDRNWTRYWRTITKVSRKVTEALLAEPDTRRLQIHALTGRAKACDWFLRGLKFDLESVMRRYGTGGEDVSLYVRLKESGYGPIWWR